MAIGHRTGRREDPYRGKPTWWDEVLRTRGRRTLRKGGGVREGTKSGRGRRMSWGSKVYKVTKKSWKTEGGALSNEPPIKRIILFVLPTKKWGRDLKKRTCRKLVTAVSALLNG